MENKFKTYDRVKFSWISDNKEETLTGTVVGFDDPLFNSKIDYIVLFDKEQHIGSEISKAFILNENRLTLIES